MSRIVVAEENNACGELCRNILEEYASLFKEDIFFHIPHGRTQDPVPDGKLHIFIWSGPEGSERTRIPTAFGYSLGEGTEDAMTPAYSGVVIEDPEGVPVAEVLEKNIYILFDLVHKTGDFVGPLMKQILDKAIPIALSKKVDIQKMRREALEKEKAQARTQYVKECSGQLDSRIQSAEKEVETVERQIEELQKELVKKIRLHEEASRELAWLSTRKEEVLKIFEPEFDKLCEAPHVERVKVEPGIISVFTDEIRIPYGGKTYRIGKFRIDIHTDGSEGGLRMHNISGYRHEGYDHPHIKRGKPCLGNIKEAVAQLIGEYQFSAVAILAIQYLESYNSEDPYRDISNWPVV